MYFNPHENVASIEIVNALGDVQSVSAVIHQDPHYLHANRISLFGTRELEIELLGFSKGGVVHWRYHVRPDWKISDDPGHDYIQRGTGILRSTGMTYGVMIADDSIQPIAEIEVIEATNELRFNEINDLKAEFWFLQRPKDGWNIYRRSRGKHEPAKLLGSWTKVASLGLRFRLLRISSYRDDERITQERERIDLPGVEIRPIESLEEPEFFKSVESMWLSFRILLAFRHRQYINTLAEFKDSASKREANWQAVRLEPRYRRRSDEAYDPPFRGKIEQYLAKGAARLGVIEQQRELLHAAAIGYATSYTAPIMESSLTACVEGIERLVEAFEQERQLTRECIAKKRWRYLGSAVREAARSIDASPEEHQAVNRALSDVPKLRLLERIDRMVQGLPRNRRGGLLELMGGAEGMIVMRNQIVHGRLIADYQRLDIERTRAQGLFELLWLGYLGNGDLQDSGWARYQVRCYASEQRTPVVD